MTFTSLYLFLLAKAVVAVINISPQVRTPSGILHGETGNTAGGRTFYKFWCIPYGKSERFEPSEPADPWVGVLDATQCEKRCSHFPFVDDMGFMTPFEGVEDCLILNVFVPKLDPKQEPVPVLVFIHGGYFAIGSSLDYSGELLLDENIILVTVNYRLGPLGFLTSGDGVLEANLGMKDQVLALTWVQQNIQYFGGDPNRVTVSGESAGAGSVSYHVLSPMSQGLFRHAIAESGTTIAPWALQTKPREVFQEFAQELNCSAPTSEESKACLKQVDIELLRKASSKTKWFVELHYPMFPSVETEPPKKPGSRIFLPDHPLRMLKEGNFNYVPFIQGVSEDEGAYQGGFTINDDEFVNDLNKRWIPVGGYAVGMETRNISIKNLNKGLRKVRRFYFGDDDIGPEHLQNLTDMYSDAWFISGLDQTIRYHSVHAPIYPYVFAKVGALQLANVFGHFNRSVVSHGDELQYLFFKGLASSDTDVAFSRRLVKLWVSFIYTGKPIATWDSVKEWPAAKPGGKDLLFYIIDEKTRLGNPFVARAKLWDDLLNNEWNDLLPK